MNPREETRHKCLSASTFTVPPVTRCWKSPRRQSHKCLSASTFTVPRWETSGLSEATCHKCLSASTFTVPESLGSGPQQTEDGVTNAYRQVHLLYLQKGYFLQNIKTCHKCLSASTFTVPAIFEAFAEGGEIVTNAYRQVHLLYLRRINQTRNHEESQMPIGKYIYCTPSFSIFIENNFLYTTFP